MFCNALKDISVTMVSMLLLLATVLSLAHMTFAEATNLVTNPSFEEDLRGTWDQNGFTMTLYAGDKVHGQYSVRCADRDSDLEGPQQDINGMAMGKGYEFRADVKLLNDIPDKVWQSLKVVLKFSFTVQPNGTTILPRISDDEYPVGSYIIAYNGFVTAAQGWHVLAGSINAPMLPFDQVRLQFRGPDPEVEFLIDNVTLFEVPENENWLQNSHAMIDANRKTNIHLSFKVPADIDKKEFDVKIEHKRHLFAFGSKVEDDAIRMKGEQNEAFRALFFNLFNWATMGSYKWRFDKGPNLYSPDFRNAVEAVDTLRQNGIKVRGHSIFWGIEENIPDAVVAASREELPDLIRFHTDYMMNISKGKLEHWDVQNEYLYGHFYEEKLHNPNVSINIFKHACPSNTWVKCYLNDFQAVNIGGNTEDYINLAKRFIKAGTGIQGLGIQGHVKDFIKPSPTMIWRRLDRLASVGLELFLTEFDIGWDDDIERADWFEDCFRAYFAHPGLSGVILWGFWRERQRYKNEYLIYGDDMKFAEQGERFVCLTQKEWTTKENRNLGYGTTFTIRGFQGDYDVIVERNGVPVQRETFVVDKDDTSVNIDVTYSTGPINVPQKFDYVPKCISHRDKKSLGSSKSSLQSYSLSCKSKTSSGDVGASISCDAGEVMTGCTSRDLSQPAGLWRGDRIVVFDGVPVCTTQSSGAKSGKVEVSARCCKGAGVQCDYRQAGPSQPFQGAMAQAVCPENMTALGCSAYSEYSVLSGAFPDDSLNSCYAESGSPSYTNPAFRSGAVSIAACCNGSLLQCRAIITEFQQPVTSSSVGVTCPRAGDVMTGCSVYASNGASKGAAFLTDRSGVTRCAANAEESTSKGVTKVVITCCH